MKIASLNINGLKSAFDSGLKSYILDVKADVFCVQETRTGKDLACYFVPGYHEFYCPSAHSGHEGVGLFTKRLPKGLIQGIGVPARGNEGRAITLETGSYYIVNVYAPTSGAALQNLENKVFWLNDLLRYVKYLEGMKPVIICGDMNVAGGVRDMPAEQLGTPSAGNTDAEREAFNKIIDAGYYDVWRMTHPNERGVSWAPYWGNGEDYDFGWRLDYFLVSEKLLDRVKKCEILSQCDISDHRCLVLEI